MENKMKMALLDALYACITECNNCSTACLDEKEMGMLSKCIKLDMDCAAICSLVATLVARGSQHGVHLMKECVEVCSACADECEKHAAMDIEHCRTCAEACRKCAEECGRM